MIFSNLRGSLRITLNSFQILLQISLKLSEASTSDLNRPENFQNCQNCQRNEISTETLGGTKQFQL